MELIEVVLPAFPDAPLRAALGTDTGRRREHNEDAVGAYQPRGLDPGAAPVDAAVIVADGVGGHEGGAWASAFVVDAARDTLSAQVGPIAGIHRWLDRLLHSIHEELLTEARNRGTPASMGSTATLAVIQGRALTLAHVGDSRAYRLRNGRMEQLTQDDSWVAEQVRAGVLASDAPEAESRKNVLTQCLGIGASLKVQIVGDHISDGDRYLLCSDGLHGVITDDELREMLEAGGTPESTSRAMIDLANERGGPDNISAVIFDVGDPPSYRPVAGARAGGAMADGAAAGGAGRATSAAGEPATREMALASVAASAEGASAAGPPPSSVHTGAAPGRRASNWITGAGAVLLMAAAGSWLTGAGRSPADRDAAAATISGDPTADVVTPAPSPPPSNGPSVPQAVTPSTEPDPVSAAAVPDSNAAPTLPDTVSSDSTRVPPDTTMIPDTTEMPRDTTTAPDTTALPDTTATHTGTLTRIPTPQERFHV